MYCPESGQNEVLTILRNKQDDLFVFISSGWLLGILSCSRVIPSATTNWKESPRHVTRSCVAGVSGSADQKAFNHNQHGKSTSGWISVSGLCITRVIGKEWKTLRMYWIIKLGNENSEELVTGTNDNGWLLRELRMSPFSQEEQSQLHAFGCWTVRAVCD